MWPWLKRKMTVPSVIGPQMCIRGQIESAGDLTIYGCVKGDIIHTGHLELAGTVDGNVQVEGTLVLRSTAQLHGDTQCTALEVHNGASFSGANRMIDGPLPVPAPVVAAVAAPPEAAPAPAVAPALAVAPLEVLMAPVGRDERELLGALKRPVESPAFYGGFSPAVR